MLALEATGKIDSIETVDPEFAYEPDTARHARYAEAIERQRRLYQKLIQGRGLQPTLRAASFDFVDRVFAAEKRSTKSHEEPRNSDVSSIKTRRISPSPENLKPET